MLFTVVVAVVWVVGALAGLIYARQQGIPQHVALAVLPAFLLEITFYLVLGVERWRKRLKLSRPPRPRACSRWRR